MSQIRLTKTTEIKKILEYLKNKWYAMDEVEIFKMAISKLYQDELNSDESIEKLSEQESIGINQSRKQIEKGDYTTYSSQDFLQSVMED